MLAGAVRWDGADRGGWRAAGSLAEANVWPGAPPVLRAFMPGPLGTGRRRRDLAAWAGGAAGITCGSGRSQPDGPASARQNRPSHVVINRRATVLWFPRRAGSTKPILPADYGRLNITLSATVNARTITGSESGAHV